MNKRAWFIPGRSGSPPGPLTRYRPAQPIRAAGAYVKALTQPNDLVVDLFCQGPTILRETVAAGRRALGFSVNPLLLIAAQLGLRQLDTDHLKASFTRLADAPKGDMPLYRHMSLLYRSTCPKCGASGTAEWFAWDRQRDRPTRKAVCCPRCAGIEEGPTDNEDVEAAHRIPARGIAYFYALDRAAPLQHPAREQTAELVGLYTPRNLSALMDLSMRLEELEVDEEARIALTAAMIDCFDTGSSLDPYGETRPRPRTLRVPAQYIERNVWLCLERQLSGLMREYTLPSVPRAEGVEALLRGERAAYALIGLPARNMREVVPPGSVALILTDLPRPDAVFWALSALWANWLWETPAARALRPLLRRRRFDWHWHWRVLRSALAAAGPLLSPEGYLVTLFTEPDGMLLASVCLATSGAGYVPAGWGYCPEVGHRLVWRWKPRSAEASQLIDAPGVAALPGILTRAATEATLSTLQGRGEPTSERLLRAGAYAALAEQNLLSRAANVSGAGLSLASDALRHALDAAPITRIAHSEKSEEALWWLQQTSQLDVTEAEPPLADRVEAKTWELLATQSVWELEELINAVYACFQGPLTPDLALVQICIDSYSVNLGAERQLRPEDNPPRRTAEINALRGDLAKLGRRLEFTVKRRGRWDVRWVEGDQEVYLFAISATAILGRHLLAQHVADGGGQCCLVLPGGRSQLVSLKLQRDPRLARAVEEGGWQFVKFRHLRQLLAEEELDRHALKTVLGLDPIVEREVAQIPLF